MDHSQWSMGAMSMNPAFYQGVPNANVDWAALAAQWIHMRETLPTDQLRLLPDAPPPPTISLLDQIPSHDTNKRLEYEEKGEAPMDMEKDEDDVIPNFDNNQVPMMPPQPPQWNSSGFGSNVSSGNNNSGGNWRNPAWQMYENSQPPSGNFNKLPPLCPELQGYSGRKRWANKSPDRGGIYSNQAPPELPNDQDTEEPETLDAAKRKTLPAWIREGLEKMEREKQREEERIKMDEQRKRLAEEKRKFQEETLNELESTKGLRSKFDFDNSDDESAPESQPVSPVKKIQPPTRTPSPKVKGGPVVIKPLKI